MARRFDVHDLKEALAERLARTGHDTEDDEIAYASHAVVELVQAGKLAAAEAAARDVVTRYPYEPDGWDCAGNAIGKCATSCATTPTTMTPHTKPSLVS
jgi:hypothetical protein